VISLLFWLYVANCSVLIIHQMDSAYWKEWNLFSFMISGKGEITDIRNFLLFNVPLVPLMLVGTLWLDGMTTRGLVMSTVVAGIGLFCFSFHLYHLQKGREEFNVMFSKVLIVSTLLLSVPQAGLSIYYFAVMSG